MNLWPELKSASLIAGLFLLPFLALSQISSIDPPAGVIGETLTVTITGIGTNFFQESNTGLSINQESTTFLPINSVDVINQTTLVAEITIPEEQEPGYFDVAFDVYAPLIDGFYVCDGCTVGCTDPTACNFVLEADFLSTCDYSCIGCTDPDACNYEPDNTVDDGSCSNELGCTDVEASNYSSIAVCEDGSCTYRFDGDVFNDENANGIWDPDETGLPFITVELAPLGWTTITNDEGHFTFFGPGLGSYDVSVVAPDNFPFVTTPNPISTEILWDTPTDDLVFGLSAEAPDFAVCVDFYPAWSWLPCNTWTNFNICYRNMGNVPIDGYVAVTYDPLMQDYVEVTAIDSVVGNTIYMGFENLGPNQMFFYDVGFLIPTADFLGTYLTSTAEVFGFDNDGNQVAYGIEVSTMEIACAYDPNDKQVFPNGFGEPHYIEPDQELEYLVRFQNVGNAPAINVWVRDTLSEHLDLETFSLMANSHSVITTLDPETREVVFFFEEIFLPDSICCEPESHGLVSYTIRPLPDLPPETVINNTAHIFFDGNEAVVTNTVWSTIYECPANIAEFEGITGPICTSSELEFENEYPYLDQWSWTINDVVVGTTDELVQIMDEAGDYTVVHNASNPFCSAEESLSFTVIDGPPISVSEDVTVCPEESVTLIADGADSYFWNGVAGGAEYTFSPTETEAVIVAGEFDGIACQTTAEINVEVYTQPEALIVDPGTYYCPGQMAEPHIELTGDGPWDFTLIVNGEETEYTQHTESILEFELTETTTIEVHDLAGSNCSSEGSFSGTVLFQDPIISGLSDVHACVAGVHTLEAQGGVTYDWIGLPNQAEVSVLVYETSTFEVVITDEHGCEITEQVLVEVSDDFEMEVTVSNLNPCEGEVVTISASGAEHYNWSDGAEGEIYTFAAAEDVTISVVGLSAFGGCQVEESFAFEVTEGFDIELESSAEVACTGQLVTITVSGADSYIWSNGFEGDEYTFNALEDEEFIVNGYFDSSECVAQAVASIQVVNDVEITVSEDVEICPGVETVLTASSSAGTLIWEGYGEGSEITVSPTETTEYVVTSTLDDDCYVSETITVSVTPLSMAAPDDTGVCLGESVTLVPTGNFESVFWYGIGFTTEPSVSPDEDTEYIVVGYLEDCAITDTMNVSVLPIPDVSISGPSSACIGDEVTLSGSGAVSYDWFSGPEGQDWTFEATLSDFVAVLGTAENGCTDGATVYLSVHALPEVSISGADWYCENEAITLTGVGALTYDWGEFGEGETVDVFPDGETTYTVIGTDDHNCSSEGTFTPVLGTMATFSIQGDLDICPGEATTLSGTGADTFQWTGFNEGPSITVLPLENSEYSLVGWDENDCPATVTVEVILLEAPAVVASEDMTICQGDNATLSATGAVFYIWSTAGSGSSISVNPMETTVYTVTGYGENGCPSSEDILVSVNESPVVDAGIDVELCHGDSTLLEASGAEEYLWNGEFAGFTLSVTPEETGTYTVVGSLANGCSDEDEVEVIVHANPAVDAGEDVEICDGDSVTLEATGADSYLWDGEVEGATLSVTPEESSTYAVEGTTAFGCVGMDEVSVIVNPLPEASFTQDSNTLTASAGTEYQWYLNGEAIDGATDQEYVISEDGNYAVEVFNEWNCSATSDEDFVVFTGIDDIEWRRSILIAPHPLTDQSVVSWDPEFRVSSLIIRDMRGRIVQPYTRVSDSNIVIDRGSLSRGIYMVELNDDTERAAIKLVVN